MLKEVEQVLGRLVAVDTTSSRPTEPIVDVLEDLLDGSNALIRRVPGPDPGKLGMIVRFGPGVPGGAVLSAHLDCVPVEGQDWSSDPFSLIRDGDRLVGRGTADMKGFIAACLVGLGGTDPARWSRPVALALSWDEELGTLGAPAVVDALLEVVPEPEAVVVGEPTGMRIVGAHKGVRSFQTVIEGRDAHSSQPQLAANAVVAGARIATFIADLADRTRRGDSDPRFDPPHTTFNVATMQGGQAINIVPRRCELTWEYRPVPADDADDLRREVDAHVSSTVLPELRANAPEASITTEPTAVVPTLRPEQDGAAERLVRAVTGEERPVDTVAYGTDGGHFQAAGLSTVVCGPGSIDQAHRADEYVELEQLEATAQMARGLAAWAADA